MRHQHDLFTAVIGQLLRQFPDRFCHLANYIIFAVPPAKLV